MRKSSIYLSFLGISIFSLSAFIGRGQPLPSPEQLFTCTPYFQKQYGGPQNEVDAAIDITNDLGYIIVGYTTSWGNGGCDATFQKVDRNGQVVWSRTIGGLGEDRLY